MLAFLLYGEAIQLFYIYIYKHRYTLQNNEADSHNDSKCHVTPDYICFVGSDPLPTLEKKPAPCHPTCESNAGCGASHHFFGWCRPDQSLRCITNADGQRGDTPNSTRWAVKHNWASRWIHELMTHCTTNLGGIGDWDHMKSSTSALLFHTLAD